MGDVPTENPTETRQINEGEQPPTKEQIEAWIDGRFKWNSDKFMNFIFNVVEDRFSDALNMAATELADDQPVESELYRIPYSMVADVFDDVRIGDALSKISSKTFCK